MKTIHEALAVGSYVDYERIIEATPGHQRFRVQIHSDHTYHHQSSARVEVWIDGQGWIKVHCPHPLSMRPTWEKLHIHAPEADLRKLARTVADGLLELAGEIVRGDK